MSTFFPRLKRTPATREQVGTTTIDTADINGGTLTRTITNSGTPEIADTTIRFKSSVPAIDKYDADRTYTGEWSTLHGGKTHDIFDVTKINNIPSTLDISHNRYTPQQWYTNNNETTTKDYGKWKLLNWQLDNRLVNSQQINQ